MGILVLSRRPRHRLYEAVGDPDSDTGVESEKLRWEKTKRLIESATTKSVFGAARLEVPA
jgi:hypothetical protein